MQGLRRQESGMPRELPRVRRVPRPGAGTERREPDRGGAGLRTVLLRHARSLRQLREGAAREGRCPAVTVVLFWILLQLDAPWWAYAIIFIRLILKILLLGYKEGSKENE